MKTEFLSVNKTTIVSVYDNIPIQTISRDELLTIIPNQNPGLQDFPQRQISLLFFDLGQTICHITNQRIIVETDDIERKKALTEIFSKTNSLIRECSKLIAYGFNYTLLYRVLAKNSTKFISEIFLKNIESIEEKGNGKVVFSSVAFDIQRDGEKIKFDVKPVEKDVILIQTNVHFDRKNLPSDIEIENDFMQKLNLSKDLLKKIMG